MALSSNTIIQTYQQYLGRAPSASEISWQQSRANPATFVSTVQNSPEARARAARPAAAATPASDPLKDFADAQKRESDALLARQNAEQEGLFGNYENIRKNQEALPALYNRLQTEAGIPGLSQTAQSFKDEIYKVKDRLDRLGEDVLARTTGTLTTEAQRRRLETSEAEPLQTNLGRLGTGLAPVADMLKSANDSVSTQLSLQTQQQERELEPVKLRINAISDRFAREITGFTANRELSLTALLDNIQRGRQLADRDWELAQTLAAEERAFARQKSLAATQLSLNQAKVTPTPVSTPTPAIDWNAYISGGKSPATTVLQPASGNIQGSTPSLQGGSYSLQGGM